MLRPAACALAPAPAAGVRYSPASFSCGTIAWSGLPVSAGSACATAPGAMVRAAMAAKMAAKFLRSLDFTVTFFDMNRSFMNH